MMGTITPRVDLPHVASKIKEFNAKRRLRRAAYSVMAANRFKNIAMMMAK